MFDLLWSIAGFVVAMSVLVCFHEFGHYWMARRLGVKVLRFSLGWGRPFKSFRTRDGVEWALAPYPIGGYVKLLDEREGPVPADQRHLAFNTQTVPRRMAILAAGPIFNFLLAIAIYWLIFVVGVPGMKPLIASPAAQSPAAQAGLKEGEEIVAVGGDEVATWTMLSTALLDHAMGGGTLSLTVRDRLGAERQVSLDLSGVRIDPEHLFADLGVEPFEPVGAPLLTQLEHGMPAQAAGLQAGDRILAIDGVPMRGPADLVRYISERPGGIVRLEVERAGERLDVELVLASAERDGKTIGRLGAGVAMPPDLWQDLRALRRLDPLAALPAAVQQTWHMSWLTLRMLGRMVTGDVSLKNVSGPLQIAEVAGDTARVGLVSFLSFMAIVSVSLGVLNLLPVPLLDGGHLLLYAIEGIKGRPLSERAQVASQYVGFAFIGTLMLLAFYNDIMRLI